MRITAADGKGSALNTDLVYTPRVQLWPVHRQKLSRPLTSLQADKPGEGGTHQQAKWEFPLFQPLVLPSVALAEVSPSPELSPTSAQSTMPMSLKIKHCSLLGWIG